MHFYQQAGFLVLGSRLRRLGDNLINDVNAVYRNQNIDFDASWFPVFYILSVEKEVSINEIANELKTSHSAVSQLVKSLIDKGYLKSKRSNIDARQKAISFTAKGSKLFFKIHPVWKALQQAMEELFPSENVLNLLTEAEVRLTEQSLLNRIEEKLSK